MIYTIVGLMFVVIGLTQSRELPGLSVGFTLAGVLFCLAGVLT